MHPLVEKKFRQWITGGGATGEGEVPYMYKDSKGYVTIGIGNKIDPLSRHPEWCKAKHYTHREHKTVTPALIRAEFKKVKAVKTWTGHGDFASMTKLRLRPASLTKLFDKKLKGLEKTLTGKYGRWFGWFDLWPADAQMGLLGLAWGFGAGGVAHKFPKLRAACFAMDFTTAAYESHYEGESKSARHRKADLKTLFLNATYVMYKRLPIHTLIFPAAKQAPLMAQPAPPI